jgi:glyceraldehyde 3-phosphate dehydrogenase
MKKIKVFVNGLGRIGRIFVRQNINNQEIDFVGFNDPNISIDNFFYLLKHDSIYGNIEIDLKKKSKKEISVNGKVIKYSMERKVLDLNPKSDIFIDSSGVGSLKHILNIKKLTVQKKTKYSLITNDINDFSSIIFNINEANISLKNKVYTTSICDTLSAAPIIDCIQKDYKILSGKIITLHPFLSYQKVVDAPEINYLKDAFVMGRSVINSLLPKSTSVVYSLNKIFSGINKKIDCMSFRVPTSIVSCGIMDLECNKILNRKKIIKILKDYSRIKKDFINLIEEPLSSIDYKKSHYAANIEVKWIVVRKNRVQFVYWYDNEWGYVNGINKIVKYFQDKL